MCSLVSSISFFSASNMILKWRSISDRKQFMPWYISNISYFHSIKTVYFRCVFQLFAWCAWCVCVVWNVATVRVGHRQQSIVHFIRTSHEFPAAYLLLLVFCLFFIRLALSFFFSPWMHSRVAIYEIDHRNEREVIIQCAALPKRSTY